MSRLPVILATILVLAFSVIFGRDQIHYRVSELDALLGQIARSEDAAGTLSIVTRYELIKRRIEKGETELANYRLEARAVTLSPDKLFAGHDESRPTTLFPVHLMLQPLRRMMGKAAMAPVDTGERYDLLATAYYWERNRRYEKASDYYHQAMTLQQYASPQLQATILLHDGFCHSLLGEYQEARRSFQEVVDRFPGTDAGILAWKLLDFLKSMEERRQNAQPQKLTALETAEQAYYLMEYSQAVVLLNRIIEASPPALLEAEARYFRGRAWEELGELDRAMSEFMELLSMNPGSRWAEQSARRLYMLGEYYGQQDRIGEQARVEISRLSDAAFFDAMGDFKGSGFSRRLPPPPVPRQKKVEGREYRPAPPLEAFQAEATGLESVPTDEQPAVGHLVNLRQMVMSPEVLLPEPLAVCFGAAELGQVDAVQIPTLPPGEYLLELRGDGVATPRLFGHVKIVMREQGVAAAEVVVLSYGMIEYRVPDDATATLTGPELNKRLEGSGLLRFVPVGTYRLEVIADHYQPLHSLIVVHRNEQVVVSPKMAPRADSLESPPVAATTLQPETQAASAAGPLPGTAGAGPAVLDSESQARALLVERSSLLQRLQKEQKKQKAFGVVRWTSLGLGLSALGGMGATIYLGSQAYQSYQQASYTSDAVAWREQTQLYQRIAITSGIIGGVGVATGMIFRTLNPRIRRIQERLHGIDAELASLKQE